MFFQKEIETMPRKEIERLQLERLRHQVDYCQKEERVLEFGEEKFVILVNGAVLRIICAGRVGIGIARKVMERDAEAKECECSFKVWVLLHRDIFVAHCTSSCLIVHLHADTSRIRIEYPAVRITPSFAYGGGGIVSKSCPNDF